MISPDVAAAVTRLEREGVLAPEQARLFGRVARGELVSLYAALQVLLYLGTLAITAGVGLLLKDQIANLGPLTLAVIVGAAAASCLAWVAHRSPTFSAGEDASPHFAVDSMLVLGALIAAADLAFIESRFSPLGDSWPYHLLLVSLGYAFLAFRFDSKTLFGLALTTFAAWRGVAAASLEHRFFGFIGETSWVRANALLCGLAFVVLARELRRRNFKAHFDPTAAFLGWILILQAIAWGMRGGDAFGLDRGGSELLHRMVLVVVGFSLAWFSWHDGRFELFVLGVLAAYVGLMASVMEAVRDEETRLFLVGVSTLALVFGLAAIHRRFPKEAEE